MPMSLADAAREYGSMETQQPNSEFLATIAKALAAARRFTQSPNAQEDDLAPLDLLIGKPGPVIEKMAYGQRVGPTMTQPADPGLLDVAGLVAPGAKAAKFAGKGTMAFTSAVERELGNYAPQVARGPMAQFGGVSGKPKVLREPPRKLVDEFASPEIAEQIAAGAPRPREAPKDTGMNRTFQGGEKAGVIRGTEAFGNITPEQATKLQRDYAKRARKGVEGKYWYDDTSRDLFRLAGEDVPTADKLTEVLASTSSRTPVGANLMYGARGHNQFLVGDPVNTGGFPQRMSREITDIMEGDAQATGLKRSPYAGGLAQHWRPDPTLRPVHDIHDVRAQGITDPLTGKAWSKGVGEAGHKFLDDQTAGAVKTLNKEAVKNIRAAREAGASEDEIAQLVQDDWTNARVQAAAWTAQRAEKDGIPLSEAAKHYGDFINEYSALITREWQPGKHGTDHLQELLKSPKAVQQDFADAMERVVTGPGGIDAIASDLGMLTDKTLLNRGEYEGVSAPGFSSRVLVGKGKGAQEIDPASATGLDTVAATHGMFGVQDQAAWNFLGGPAPIKSGTGIQFKRGTPFSRDELERLSAKNVGADIPQVDPEGARALVFTDPSKEAGDPEALLRTEMMKNARAAAKDFGADVEMRHRSSNIFPTDENYNAPEKWSAKPFVERIEAGGPEMVKRWNEKMPARAAGLLQVVEQKSVEHGLTSAPFYKPMMKGIARGGLPELKRLIAAGVVPVAVLAAFGLGQTMGTDDAQ